MEVWGVSVPNDRSGTAALRLMVGRAKSCRAYIEPARSAQGRRLMLRDLAAALLGLGAFAYAYAIPVEEEDAADLEAYDQNEQAWAQQRAREKEQVDEDLAWIDEKIRRAEEGPPNTAAESPDMLAARWEYVERLKRVRARMVEGEIA
jgi:hypothetical protein